MNNRWAMSGVATQQQEFLLEIRHVVGVIDAPTYEEAIELARKITRKCYPKSQGWKRHDTSIQNMNDVSPLESGERIQSEVYARRYHRKES